MLALASWPGCWASWRPARPQKPSSVSWSTNGNMKQVKNWKLYNYRGNDVMSRCLQFTFGDKGEVYMLDESALPVTEKDSKLERKKSISPRIK